MEVVAQRGNVFLDLRCAANGAGVGRLALVGAVGLLCDSACIPNVLVGNGQVFNVLGYAAGFAGAVNAASVLAGGGGGLFFPVVADGCNGLGLGFVADGAGVQLLPCLGAGGGLGHNAVVPLVVFGDRQVFNKLGVAAALADVFHLARVLAGGRGGDFLVVVAERVGVVVLVGFFGVLVAGVQRVALLGAGGVNHGHGKGVLLGRDGLGVGMGRVVLAGKGHFTVALVGRLDSHLTRIPLVAQLCNGLGLGVAGIIFTSVGFNAVRLTGRRGSDFAVVPIVAQCGNNFGLGLGAAIMGAGVGHHTVFLTGCGFGDCAGFSKGVAQRGDGLGLSVAGIVLADVGQHAVCGAGGRGGDFTGAPVVAEGINLFGLGFGATVVCAFVGLLTAGLTSRLDGDCAVIPLVASCRNCSRVGCIAAGAAEGENAVLGAGGGLRDLACIPIVTERGNRFGLSRAVTFAGVGLDAFGGAGRLGGDNTVIVIVAEGVGVIALLGKGSVLVADVDGVALLGAGRGDGLTLVPRLVQHGDVLGAGLAANRTGKGLDALLINCCGLGDNAVIPTVGQLGGVLAFVGQTGNFVALVDGVALGRAGRRDDLFNMVGFIQFGRLLGAGLATGLAGVSN